MMKPLTYMPTKSVLALYILCMVSCFPRFYQDPGVPFILPIIHLWSSIMCIRAHGGKKWEEASELVERAWHFAVAA